MQVRKTKKELGAILVEKGIITPELLLNALDVVSKDTAKNRRKLHQVLVDDFKADRDLVYREVADYYAFRSLDLSKTSIDERQVEFIRRELNGLPESVRELAVENKVMPFLIDPKAPDRLVIITPDPTRADVYFIARAFPYRKFEISYVPASQWDDLWRKVNIARSTYRDKETKLHDVNPMQELEEDAEIFEQDLEEEIHRSGLVDLVENILMDAVRVGASDIHVIPRGDKKTDFYFRIDGRLTLWYSHNETRAEAVAAVVKDHAINVDRFERNAAQDGFAQSIVDKKTIRFRVSVIPIVGKELRNKFESIVIRVLHEPSISLDLGELGFDGEAGQKFRKAISKPYGIIIVTGPTGSGKSTTLVAALKAVMDPSLNVITVEDPVEYYIEGARQVKLNPKLDFEGALRAILRHDPDIVMVGEMRDSLTANIAVKLANTGHLTLSTLHTNDAPSAVSRLYKMGVEPFLIAYSINVVVAQRLLRKLCERCKSPMQDPDRDILRRLGMTDEEIDGAKLHRAIGCKECVQGYKGRKAIHEVLYFTKEIRRLILDADKSVDEEAVRQQAVAQGMRTLRQSAVELMKKGIVSIDEVASTTVDED